MKKQTAVDQLRERLFYEFGFSYSDNIHEELKAIEKEQQQETFKQSRLAKIFEKDMPPIWENFEHYYNETYKNTLK
jgi:hypothetical protein